MKIEYLTPPKLHKVTANQIEIINHTLVQNALENPSLPLTMKQLFYKLVQLGAIENTTHAYANLGTTCKTGRLGGLIDWDYISESVNLFTPSFTSAEYNVVMQNEAVAYQLSSQLGFNCKVWSLPFYASLGAMRNLAVNLPAGAKVLYMSNYDKNAETIGQEVERRLRVFNDNFEFRHIGISEKFCKELNLAKNPTLTEKKSTGYELECVSISLLKNLVTKEIK